MFVFTGDDSGKEWYEEPITIVGFVAGFLLLILVFASILILCHSKDDDDEDEESEAGGQYSGAQLNGRSAEYVRRPEARHVERDQSWTSVSDRTNPLYLNANEFDLHPYPQALRAKFVHIHLDNKTPNDSNYRAYYNK